MADQPSGSADKRVWWSEDETVVMLEIIDEMGVVRELVSRRQKNAEIFQKVEQRLADVGYKKTWEQIRTRWKKIKADFLKAKFPGDHSRSRYQDLMGKILDSVADSPTMQMDEYCKQEEESEGLEEVNVQVQLVEEDIPIEDRVQFSEKSDDLSADTECATIQDPPCSGTSNSSEEPEKKIDSNADENDDQAGSETPSTLKGFAEEYSRKHIQYLKEWQTQYQEWFEKQMEMQRRWEDGFLQQQMEMAKSMMESVTGTFLQGMQQILHNIIASMARRPFPPFCPPMPVHFNIGAPYSSSSAGVPHFSSSSTNTGAIYSQQSVKSQAAGHKEL